jgi:hypothetical protein
MRRPKFLGGEATRRATRRQALARQIPYNRGIAGDCRIVERGFMFCRSLPNRTLSGIHLCRLIDALFSRHLLWHPPRLV